MSPTIHVIDLEPVWDKLDPDIHEMWVESNLLYAAEEGDNLKGFFEYVSQPLEIFEYDEENDVDYSAPESISTYFELLKEHGHDIPEDVIREYITPYLVPSVPFEKIFTKQIDPKKLKVGDIIEIDTNNVRVVNTFFLVGPKKNIINISDEYGPDLDKLQEYGFDPNNYDF